MLDKTSANRLEKEVIQKGIKGRDIEPGRFTWDGRYFLYPYVKDSISKRWVPAFEVPGKGIDALDFSLSLDETERSIKTRIQDSVERAKALYKHRRARALYKIWANQ